MTFDVGATDHFASIAQLNRNLTYIERMKNGMLILKLLEDCDLDKTVDDRSKP